MTSIATLDFWRRWLHISVGEMILMKPSLKDFFSPEKEANAVVFFDHEHKKWKYGARPEKILASSNVDNVASILVAVEKEVELNGFYAVGFVSYDAAGAFDSKHAVKGDENHPLIWFGLYKTLKDLDVSFIFNSGVEEKKHDLEWESVSSKDCYDVAFHRVKDHIFDGDVYQVNLSYRVRSNVNDTWCPWAYYINLVKNQGLTHTGYSAYIDTGDFVIASVSPELFFSLDDNRLLSSPMKGTSARGRYVEEDLFLRDDLYHSEKNRAENLMITDMVRNDLSRISMNASVRTTRLFGVEKYPTFWTMVSDVECETEANIEEIFRALFPAASITGAPKIRSMEIIKELEQSSRQLYTGSVGFISPKRRAQFNVAIRTILCDMKKREIKYGVGGGIVADSKLESEFKESELKAKVFGNSRPSFSLVETLLWRPETGYHFLEQHLERLNQSRIFFLWRIDMDAIRAALSKEAEKFSNEPMRVRLSVGQDGSAIVSSRHAPKKSEDNSYVVVLCDEPIDIQDVFFYHKTDHRLFYDRALSRFPRADDVILYNARNEITESCIANVYLKIDGGYYTPPVSSGLLAGVGRHHLMESRRVKEKILTKEDLFRADEIRLVNSVRGDWLVTLQE